MTIRPSEPEIITVISEALQTQVRDLLPSQNGFGSELQASNVITPIIDLTSTAEGSGLPTYLQTALAFGSQTAFEANNSTVVVANSPGFYRIYAGVGKTSSTAGTVQCNFTMTDGVTTKTIWGLETPAFINATGPVVVDFTVFLAAGESISATTDNADAFIKGSVRQVATGDGTLVQPNGYPL